MYPGTIFNLHDQSEIGQQNVTTQIDNSPLLMVVSSFDKGPEDFVTISGSDFNSLYGQMYFEKHGQNAIQAQRIIDAGGRLFCKRVCADDATLANVIMVATVKKIETQKVNENGDLLYRGDDMEETTETNENPIMIKSLNVKWDARYVSNCKTFNEVKAEALKMLNEDEGVYPLAFFTDNGRGVSGKAIRIIPDYSASKTIGNTFYTAAVYEGTVGIEPVSITINPYVVYSSESFGLDENSLTQVKGNVIDVVYDAYVNKIADILEMDVETVNKYDVLYGYTNSGASIEGFTVDAESVDFNSVYGIELKEGSNGVFGNKPVNTPAWTEAIRKVFAGEVTDKIWDVDQFKIAAVIDANFPLEVKEAIAKFVTFRKDCIFFRDLGVNLNTFIEIKEAFTKNTVCNEFIADYATSYIVKDPVTKKNISVTMLYDMAECIVRHIANNPFNPLAGTINGFVLKNAIKGTINFTPIVTPTVNQKQAMDDLKVNYAIFEDDNCVVQTLYTSKKKNTQLSYINNILGIQHVARAVRTACPRNRYSLVTGDDMNNYATAVNNVLSNFVGNFASLNFEYTRDKLKASQKIFYASIKFKFNNWAQTEVFDLYALGND